jgi:hypothetical protein
VWSITIEGGIGLASIVPSSEELLRGVISIVHRYPIFPSAAITADSLWQSLSCVESLRDHVPDPEFLRAEEFHPDGSMKQRAQREQY